MREWDIGAAIELHNRLKPDERVVGTRDLFAEAISEAQDAGWVLSHSPRWFPVSRGEPEVWDDYFEDTEDGQEHLS